MKWGQINAVVSDGVVCVTGVSSAVIQRMQVVMVGSGIGTGVDSDDHINVIYDTWAKGCVTKDNNWAVSSSTIIVVALHHNLG